MALKKSQLYSSLWKSCDELRGSMDASQYKDYVLTLLFMKYVSDKSEQPGFLIDVPKGGSFDDMVALKGDKEIGDKVNKIIGKLAQANDLKGVINAADFNDEDKLGKGKEMQDRLSKLLAIFNDLDFSSNRADGDDLLGDAYEYLMRHFATESGKSKGQFYTPAEVSRIMSKVVGIGSKTSQDKTIYDPTCGSGSLLLKAADEAPRGMTIYGQEKDDTTWKLAKMNMILHGHPTAEIWKDNTLSKPYFKNSKGGLQTFDFAVANPPFSTKSWSNGFDPANDQFGRFEYGTPPAKNGDYSFLLHVLKSLKSTGKAAIILPHGVLFRGNAEADIRKNLIKRGFVKGIIGLPANLFYGTGIPACIIVLDKNNAHARTGIFMVDASKGFVKDGNKNRLRDQDIHKVVDAFINQTKLSRFSRMVPVSEIAGPANDYNLNIPRYIDSSEPEDLHDIEGHLRGGIPNRDIDELGNYWKVFPTLRKTVFKKGDRAGYSLAKIESQKVKSEILAHEEYITFADKGMKIFARWCGQHEPALNALRKGSVAKKIINVLSEDILSRFEKFLLLDEYDAYQRLMDYWAEIMQDDVYLITAEGWTEAAKPRGIIDDKEKKIKETPDLVIKKSKYKMDLIPPSLIVARYFTEEKAAIDELESKVEAISQELEEFTEENSGEEGALEGVASKKEAEAALHEYMILAWKSFDAKMHSSYENLIVKQEKTQDKLFELKEGKCLQSLKNSKGNITLSVIKTKLKASISGQDKAKLDNFLSLDKQSKDFKKEQKELLESASVRIDELINSGSESEFVFEIKVIRRYIELEKDIQQIKKTIKAQQLELDKNTLLQYGKLSIDEIKCLVVNDKWLATMQAAVIEELERIIQRLASRVKELEDRYAETLPELTDQINEYSSKVEAHLVEMGDEMVEKTKTIIIWAIVSLVIMGLLAYFTNIKYDFIIAWAALFAGLGGITSWIYKNETMRKNDTAKLSDSRQERLSIIASDILEKTYHVHRAIQVTASTFSSPNEMYTIEDEKKDKTEEEPKDGFKLRPNVSQAEIFGHRFQRYEKLFSEYYSLDIKAKVYFNETVVKHIDEMKSVISFINSSITRLYRYSNKKYRPPKNQDQAFEREQRVSKIMEEIWAFSDPDSYETFFTTEEIRDLFKERIEAFACVCEKLDAELGDYIRGVK